MERCERALQALRAKDPPPSATAAAQRAVHTAQELHRHAPAPVTVPRASSGSLGGGASPPARGPAVHWAASATERTATPTSEDSAPASPIWPSRSERSAHFERLASGGSMGDPWSHSTSLEEDEGPERGALRRQGSVTSARMRDACAHDACHQLSVRMGVPWAGWTASGAQWGVNLVFLSARPESYKGFTEADSYKRIFAPLRVPGGLPYMPVLLLGDLSSAPRVR